MGETEDCAEVQLNYIKLFSSILDSTLWDCDLPTKVVWITMLAMADQDGVVSASVPGLAKRAGVSRQDCERALDHFLSPDPDSSRPDHDGRRIERTADGWRLLNFGLFQGLESQPAPQVTVEANTYFIQSSCADGLIKIGRSTDVQSRMAALATGSAAPLRLLAVIHRDVESTLHRKFAHLRRHGEWFAPHQDLLDFIREASTHA